jgi:hypothetical protein
VNPLLASTVSVTTAVAVTSALASAGGLVFVGWSLRILIMQMRTQTYQAVYSHQQELDSLMFQRLDLKRIIEGKQPLPEPDDPLYEEAMALVEMHLTMFEHVWAHLSSMSSGIAAQWQSYIPSMVANTAFRAYLADAPPGWFAPGFLSYVSKAQRR